MFDVGFTEILLIGIVSLVVIGPERLPVVAKTAGQWIGKLQRFVKGVKTDLASELETGDLKKLIGDQREQIDELRNMVSTAKKDFQSTTQSVVKSTRENLAELETSINEAQADDATEADTVATDSSASDITKAQQTSSSEPAVPGTTGSESSVEQLASNDSMDAKKRTGTTDSDAS